MLKNTPSTEIVHTIRYVNKGYFELAPGLLETLLSQLNNNSYDQNVVALEQQLKGYLYQLEDLIKTEPKQLINGTLNQLRDQLISTLDLKLYSVKNKQGEIIQVFKKFQHKLYIYLIAQSCVILLFMIYYLLSAK